MFDWTHLLFVFFLSFSITVVLVLTRRRHMSLFSGPNDLNAAQAIHAAPTPRIGGLAIMVAMLAVLALAARTDVLFGLIALTLIPVFLAGLAEDLGIRVTPQGRLMAAAGSAWLATLMLAVWIPASGIPAVDVLLNLAPFAIPFTILWSAGVCHGFNLIDGVNGLAAGTAVAIALGLWAVASQVGDPALAHLSVALIPAILGFLALNWPWGRIFLGDAGAYSIGHLLVWVAILLAWRTPEVSPAALSLMFFWPVADTFLAMLRRRRTGKAFDVPDRMHFHQVTYRFLSARLRERLSPLWINSLTGLILVPFTGLPVIVAVLLWDRPFLAVLAWGVFGAAFVGVYVASLRSIRRRSWRAQWLRPAGLRALTHTRPETLEPNMT
jgi:UDP-GlcNAc:undecaprenyl-phosphate/decaprenyl-phosphate GlcNAc-1-phosphate transferase